ncbi:MAG TPA: winged helix-turn-helix domain-containing protein [Gemmatimonadaceae bacterium]|nr:winged helix-turn-helix domain-containing protein [Gemmatimonadaceae bacterium]
MRPNGNTDSPPVPLLVLRHGPVAAKHLDALRANPGVELIEPAGWTHDAVALSQRVSATLVATMSDPLRALAYAVTAGVAGSILMGVAARFRGERAVLRDAGALGVYTLPLDRSSVDAILAHVDPRPRTTQTDTTLRLTLDPIARVARFRERSVRLSQREFAVLHCLSSRSGKPVDADELLREVWGNDVAAGRPRQILDVYVCQLRKKLETLGIANAIATVRRYGYALNGEGAR